MNRGCVSVFLGLVLFWSVMLFVLFGMAGCTPFLSSYSAGTVADYVEQGIQ